jgi:hypothetical protein
MLAMRIECMLSALSYIRAYGRGANFKIGDDISRAIGTSDWNEAHRLQYTQSRIHGLQLCEQMSQRLTAEKKESYRRAAAQPD